VFLLAVGEVNTLLSLRMTPVWLCILQTVVR